MRQRLTYDIAVSEDGATWASMVRGDELFSRTPEEVARSVLESWIIEHPEQLTGGERVIVPTERHPYDAETITAKVRVQLFTGPADSASGEPVMVGYLGHDKRDYTGELAVADGELVQRVRKYAGAARETLTKHRGKAMAAGAASLLAGVFAVRRLRSRSRTPQA